MKSKSEDGLGEMEWPKWLANLVIMGFVGGDEALFWLISLYAIYDDKIEPGNGYYKSLGYTDGQIRALVDGLVSNHLMVEDSGFYIPTRMKPLNAGELRNVISLIETWNRLGMPKVYLFSDQDGSVILRPYIVWWMKHLTDKLDTYTHGNSLYWDHVFSGIPKDPFFKKFRPSLFWAIRPEPREWLAERGKLSKAEMKKNIPENIPDLDILDHGLD